MNDFESQFQGVVEFLGHAAKNVMSAIDQATFAMLVNNLKENDYDVVAEVIGQLEKEKRLLAIPPLYFVSQAHPNPYVRTRAKQALVQFGQLEEISKLTAGKTPAEGTQALIARFGNYRC